MKKQQDVLKLCEVLRTLMDARSTYNVTFINTVETLCTLIEEECEEVNKKCLK